MKEAIFEAKMGLNEGGIPIGSVIVYQDKIIGRGHNQRVQNGNPLLHGEMDAFQNAFKILFENSGKTGYNKKMFRFENIQKINIFCEIFKK